MRSSLVLFGLAAFALADLNQNANEMRDVQDVDGSKVESDSPSRVLARAAACCSNYPNSSECVSGHTHLFLLSKMKKEVNHVVPTTTIDELRGKVEKGPAVPSCYNYNTRQLRAEHFNATF
ncbi:hypothetical protein E4U10_007551 [Claviceps purpurea]|nr:hypothetical protein E4U10_007551 [Claviceps purpurea]KAG6310064.1 hypothetical protein E4U44_005946 [Claviceps purpurea]